MSYHPHGTPSFRNLIARPMWITLKTALRTVPFLGKLKFLKSGYHAQSADMMDPETANRVGESHPSSGQSFSADREPSPQGTGGRRGKRGRVTHAQSTPEPRHV